MERVAVLIGRCAIYEQLYLTNDAPNNANEATENLRRGLLTLYTAILHALCRFIRVFQGKVPYCLFFCSLGPRPSEKSGYPRRGFVPGSIPASWMANIFIPKCSH